MNLINCSPGSDIHRFYQSNHHCGLGTQEALEWVVIAVASGSPLSLNDPELIRHQQPDGAVRQVNFNTDCKVEVQGSNTGSLLMPSHQNQSKKALLTENKTSIRTVQVQVVHVFCGPPF